MADPLADGAPGGSTAGGESNVYALLLARGAEAESGCAGLLGDGEMKLARCSNENSPFEGAGANTASPLFAAVPNRFASQVAGAAERAGSSACSITDCWSFELDGGPGGSDVA